MVFDKIGKALGRGARALGGGDLEVIKWPDHLDPREYVAWRYPKEEIRWGSFVVVEESQRAVFLRDGKLLGILGPGRHVLDTQNVPFLQGLAEGLYGETPFKAAIIFVNLVQYDAAFGDRAFVDWIGVHLLFNGKYYFTVDENRVEQFIVRFMGTREEVTVDDVRKTLNPFIVSKLIEAFAEYATQQAQAGRVMQNVSDFLAMLQEFSEYAKASVAQKVDEMYGIKIVDLAFKIDISEEDKRILQMSGPRAFAAMYQRDWMGRERIAESLSKAQGAGAVAPFVMMPWMMYPPYPPPYPPGQPPMTPPRPPQQGGGQQGSQPPYPPGYPPGYPPPGYPGYPYPPQPYPYPQPQHPAQPGYPQPPQPGQPGQQPQQPPQPWAPQQGGPRPLYQQPPQAQPGAVGAQALPAPQPPGQAVPPQQRQPQQAGAAQRPRCPYCGAEIPPWTPVCPYCAQPIKWCPDGRPVKANEQC